jgi:DNA-directed RNA polymerase specialized sigma24 family protein
MLVGHAAATALRGRRCRARQATRPLEAALPAGEPVDPRAGPERATALTLDVEVVLAAVPPDLRRVARAVGTRSVAEAARHLGMPRPTLYRRLRELRAAFEAAGFGEFG